MIGFLKEILVVVKQDCFGDRYATLFLLSFGACTNILQDAKAIEVISQEIDTYLPIFSLENNSDESLVEEWAPEQRNSCIYLENTVNETLRLAGAPLMIRKCH